MKNKEYKIPPEDLEEYIGSSIGCIASDMITVDGEGVGYMYREEAEEDFDSGWRFFSGKESQEYADNAENFSFYRINTIINYDPAILPYINLPIGSSLVRKESSNIFTFIEE